MISKYRRQPFRLGKGGALPRLKELKVKKNKKNEK